MSDKPQLKPGSPKSEIYLHHVNLCLKQAKEAPLPRVRERCLRAAAAWKEMHEKAELFERRLAR